MHRRIALAGLLIGSAALADSWMPFGERLWVSEDGSHYVVIDADRGDAELRFYKRQEGQRAPFLRPDNWRRSKVVVDPKAVPLRATAIDQLPLDAWVLSETPRVILLDQYGGTGYGTTLAMLDSNGKTIWSHELKDFQFRRKVFSRSVSSVHWNLGWWVDEERSKVVVIARGGQYREVDLELGDIRQTGPPVVQTALHKGSSAVRRAALAYCRMDRGNDSLRGWIPIAKVIRDDAERPMLERLAAARALQLAADKSAPIRLYREALKQLDDLEIRQTVLDDARILFKELGAPLVGAILTYDPSWRPYSCAITLSFMGPDGLSAIGEFASDPEVPVKARLDALRALLNNDVKGSHEAFARCVRGASDEFASEAIRRLNSLSVDASATALAAVLVKPGAGDRAIARYLGENPDRKFLPALESALKRASGDPDRRAVIETAIKRCRAAK